MATKKDVVDKVADQMDLQQTFNPLLAALKENDKKNLFDSTINTAFIKTGFPVFDYYFGAVINIHDELGKLVKQEGRVGQAAGTFNLIIGNTGSGKSSLAIQILGNIIRQYPFSNGILFDCEQRTDISRCENITKLPAKFFDNKNGPSRFIYKSGAVSLEVIQEMIVKMYVSKMKLKKELTIETGFKDEFGNNATMLQPTVIIIDSITTVINETFSPDNAKDMSNAEKMRGNTDGARDAKTLKGFFKDILPLCKEANIIIYGINHINSNISMNAFVPVAKQQNFLKQDESIPGGKTMLYYPYNIIKLTAKPSDDFSEETDGFSGHVVMVEPIKSSSNQSGNERKGLSFEMIFSFKDGFDPLRTMIWYGKNYGFIEGNKTRMKFKGDDSFTFTWKNLYKEVDEKPIWDCLRKYVYPHLETHLSFMEPTDSKFDENIFMY